MRKYAGISVFLILMLVLGMLVLGGCDTPTPPVDDDENGVPDDGDPDDGTPDDGVFKQIVVALAGQGQSLDPHNHRNRNSQTITRYWTDALTQQLSDGAHVLDVAESIEQLEDEVTYEIKIKEGIYFHNGDPLTAEDLAFTIQRVAMEGGMEGETSPRRPLTGPVESVEVIDDYTVRLTLERPNTLVQVRNWYHYEIIPKKYFEEVGVEGFIQQPIGIGPYKWVEGDLLTQIVFERNDNYYGGAPELGPELDRVPDIDRIIMKFIPEATTRVAALLAGEVDIIQRVPLDSIQLLESNPNVRVESTGGTNGRVIWFNVNRAPFDDIRVRQAFAYGIDYDALTQQLLLGFADPMYGRPFMEPYAGEAGEGAFSHIKGYDYDPDKARALLEEAGVIGTNVVIDCYDFVEEAQAVAQMMNDVGLNVSVRVWEYGAVREAVSAGERSVYYAVFGNGRKAPQWVHNLVGAGMPNNYSNYNNPVFEDLIDRAMAITEDTPERNALFIEAFELVMEEVPVLAVHQPRVVEACNDKLKNFFPHGGGRVNPHRLFLEVD